MGQTLSSRARAPEQLLLLLVRSAGGSLMTDGCCSVGRPLQGPGHTVLAA